MSCRAAALRGGPHRMPGTEGIVHDEMLNLFDDCITRMLDLRGRLAATRCVRPGERHTTVLAAIAEAEYFATTASATVAATSPPQPAATVGSGA